LDGFEDFALGIAAASFCLKHYCLSSNALNKRYSGKPDALLPLKAKVGNAQLKIIVELPKQVRD
jgi:hypothetical protein